MVQFVNRAKISYCQREMGNEKFSVYLAHSVWCFFRSFVREMWKVEDTLKAVSKVLSPCDVQM